MEAAATLPFDQGMARERELFMQCMQNSQAKALQHVFFAERKAANVPNLDKSVTKRDIKSVAHHRRRHHGRRHRDELS